ncbi:MAG: prepilin-type N-terminal cleavage/methylation domain-containing protein [Sedimentisphaerales bacterium]|nr:prepilin-type N-terminal cleavage/methylation domain-containing protein [Sedimentisphaerales bacterium]
MFKYKAIKRSNRGLTLIEMVISLAIAVVIIAAMLPQLSAINAGWESRQASSEALQNGRVLIDHLNQNLIKAVSINDVSESSATNGYIEFQDADDVVYRYQVTSGIVQFGQVGSEADLAGPVSRFQITCYDDDDLDTPLTISTAGVEDIRFVKVAVTMTNSSSLGQDKDLIASAYLRVGEETAKPSVIGPDSETIAMCKIDETHFLFADGNDKVMVLETNLLDYTTAVVGTYTTSRDHEMPAICKIDDTHYLWAYSRQNRGYASVLTVNPANWSITEGSLYYYDNKGEWPALAKIDDTHYLCLYSSNGSDGWATVLTVYTYYGSWYVSHNYRNSYEYDNRKGIQANIAKIDDSHYLCIYNDNDYAKIFVMNVDGSYRLSAEDKYWFCYNPSNDRFPLIRIDSGHYLCVFSGGGNNDDTDALVITVSSYYYHHNWYWSIGAASSLEIDNYGRNCIDAAQLDTNNYICTYTDKDRENSYYVDLSINSSTWNMTKGAPTVFHSEKAKEGSPIIEAGNSTLGLCIYSDDDSRGDTYGLIIGLDNVLMP